MQSLALIISVILRNKIKYFLCLDASIDISRWDQHGVDRFRYGNFHCRSQEIVEKPQWMHGLWVPPTGLSLSVPGLETQYVSSDKCLRAGGRLVLCDMLYRQLPTDAEKVEAHALIETKDSNGGWLESLSRRVHEVTIAIVPVELIRAAFLCGRLWGGDLDYHSKLLALPTICPDPLLPMLQILARPGLFFLESWEHLASKLLVPGMTGEHNES